ncbi:MAG TPA: magnesium transporter CorA family protein [Pirellulaceae bacterium]|nr:magnesium transporter CorA family protein [Planctomycetales bacterium]MCB9938792.1 magnesium transporter CorA family protein [Planctomycetaceae bacterium]HRX78762.1 magnesium transporter CorA family protein [Pirellulaceae bacterium]
MVSVVEFDFETKQEREIPAHTTRSACDKGLHCWIDLDLTDQSAAEDLLRQLGVNPVVIEEALGPAVDARHDVYEDCLHVGISATTLKDGRVVTTHVSLILGERFIVTLRHGDVEFLSQIRRTYRRDFVEFAKTLSFLLYEFSDHLIDSYTKVQRQIESQVEEVQQRVFHDADERIFCHGATVTRELLSFRKLVLEAREVLHELAVRRSPFVSESTQPYLHNLVGTLERLSSDLAVEREILAESLNLYIGIVSQRTNELVRRLTLVSMIFLPLTFLCGVYGMNFDHLPELHWKWGYLGFWLLVGGIVTGLLVAMRRMRWL